MQKVRWGILSTAKIAREQLIPGIKLAENAEVVAVASRNEEKAAAFAAENGIGRSYGSYEALLADPEIDAVYNPLPNHLHVPMTKAAAEAGKHVLCEKPIALNAEEAATLRALPEDVMIMEAFMVRFHPQWAKAREIVQSGRIGDVYAAQGFFSYFNRDEANIRQKPEWGGGALMDIGVYPLVTSRFVFDAEPSRVMSLVKRQADFGVDCLASALVEFPGGEHLTFTVSMELANHQRMTFLGTKGRVEVVIPFNSPHDVPTKVIVNDGSKLGNEGDEIIEIPTAHQYHLEVEAFSNAILTGDKLQYDVEDSVRSMRILDALFRSEKSGSWENV